MGHREKIKGGDEQDVFSGWRRLLCYTGRPGVTKAIKSKFNRRIRKEAKRAAFSEARTA